MIRRPVIRRLAPAALLVVLAACSSITFSSDRLDAIQQELNRHYRDWKSQRIASYEYHFVRFCLCDPNLTRPAVVNVVDSAVARVTYGDGSTAPDSLLRSFFTVEGLFQQVQVAINLGVDSLVVEYDPTLHYPTKIVVDQDRLVPNDELALFASDLVRR
jgi:hypothetical protein